MIDCLLKDKNRNNCELNLKLMHGTYKDVIILDLAKIFTDSKNDQTALNQIIERLNNKKFAKHKKQLNFLKRKHRGLFSKIQKNRNKLIGHLDFHKNPYFRMGYSKDVLDEWYPIIEPNPHPKNFYSYFELESKNDENKRLRKDMLAKPENQRYEIIDFKKDIPTFKTILNELDKIFNEIDKIIYPKKYN
ncbi:MAG: hypothetical protein AB1465_05685 [Patescibacteria group bacterium]